MAYHRLVGLKCKPSSKEFKIEKYLRQFMPKLLYPHLHRGWGYSDFGENLFYHTLKIKNAELVTLILHF